MQLCMRLANFHDTDIRDVSLRAVNRSRSNSQAHSQTHQSRIHGCDVRGSQVERMPHQDGCLYNCKQRATYLDPSI